MATRIADLISVFISVLNQIKIYHWQTKVYSRHVASDTLYKNLSKNIDKFVEVLLGKLEGNRFLLSVANNELLLDNQTDRTIIEILTNFKNYLNRINFSITSSITLKESGDLMNIKDEMISDIEQTLYLFTLE
jgi:DNA-binding ferritin-like protein